MKEAATLSQIKAARRGSEAAFGALLLREMPVVKYFARLATCSYLDYDDAVQEGLIGLFAAINRYETGQGASFETFAAACIRNSVLAARRSAARKKHAPLNQSVPLSEAQSIPGPEESAIAHEEVSLALQKARSVLSPFEKRVLLYHLDGYSYTEIAKRMAVEKKAVDNALTRLRRKLR